MNFIDLEQQRLENMESFTPIYVEYLFEQLLQVLIAYTQIFWNDNLFLDQKGEINNDLSYPCLEKFAKSFGEKLNHFKLEVIIIFFILFSRDFSFNLETRTI